MAELPTAGEKTSRIKEAMKAAVIAEKGNGGGGGE